MGPAVQRIPWPRTQVKQRPTVTPPYRRTRDHDPKAKTVVEPRYHGDNPYLLGQPQWSRPPVLVARQSHGISFGCSKREKGKEGWVSSITDVLLATSLLVDSSLTSFSGPGPGPSQRLIVWHRSLDTILHHEADTFGNFLERVAVM